MKFILIAKLLAVILVVVLLIVAFWAKSSALNIYLAVVISSIAIIYYRLDYIHPLVAYLVPWSFICVLSQLKISAVSRDFSLETSYLFIGAFFSSIAYYMLMTKQKKSPNISALQTVPQQQIYNRRYYLAVGVYILLLIINAVYSKYLPIVNLVLLGKGETGYIGFGIPTLYGFFNAYANALAILSLFFFLTTRHRVYIIVYLLIIALFVVLMSRQNIVSVLVESVVVLTFIKGRISLFRLIVYILLFLGFFAIVGELRTGDITGLVKLNENYDWLPKGFIWLYSYSYFNLLNFDNLVIALDGGQYDGSSLHQFIPSFIRPTEFDPSQFREIHAFTVSSYMFDIYYDIGFLGVILFTIFMQIIGGLAYNSAINKMTYRAIAIYSVIFFSVSFSFFVNFLFYLPVIFQVAFIYIFHHILIRRGAHLRF